MKRYLFKLLFIMKHLLVGLLQFGLILMDNPVVGSCLRLKMFQIILCRNKRHSDIMNFAVFLVDRFFECFDGGERVYILHSHRFHLLFQFRLLRVCQ